MGYSRVLDLLRWHVDRLSRWSHYVACKCTQNNIWQAYLMSADSSFGLAFDTTSDTNDGSHQSPDICLSIVRTTGMRE